MPPSPEGLLYKNIKLERDVEIGGCKLTRGMVLGDPVEPHSDHLSIKDERLIGRVLEFRKIVQLQREDEEPPTILWPHFGISTKTLAFNLLRGALSVVLAVLAVYVLVYVPYAMFLVRPNATAGANEDASLFQFAAMVSA